MDGQWVHCLRRLKRTGLTAFYWSVVENVLSTHPHRVNCEPLCCWQEGLTLHHQITNSSPASLEDIYISQRQGRATSILKEPSHPAHELFTRGPKTRTTRLKTRGCKTEKLFPIARGYQLSEPAIRKKMYGSPALKEKYMTVRFLSIHVLWGKAGNVIWWRLYFVTLTVKVCLHIWPLWLKQRQKSVPFWWLWRK